MRIALISDIHGNTVALDAVLADLESVAAVDEYWFLGDYVAIGSDPTGVLDRITKLPNATFTRGNTDRYTTTGDRPPPTFEDVSENPDLGPRLVEVARSFAWTQGVITSAGYYDWLNELPLEKRITLPDGTNILGVHASPGRDDGGGFNPSATETELSQLFWNAEADLVFVGHTHAAIEADIGTLRVVNLGSVSNHSSEDVRSSYVILNASADSHSVERRFVDYNHQAAIDHVRSVNHPAADFIIRHLSGEFTADWSNWTSFTSSKKS
jgi:predicted phosphodiesterase